MLMQQQILVLMRMHELEKSLGELYALFSEKFPEYSKLWDHLGREEQNHAEAVRKLYQESYKGEVVFEEGNIKAEGVQSVIDYVKETSSLTTRGQLSAVKALSITYDIEGSVLDKTIFKHFRVTPQFVDTIRMLQQETQGHAQMAKDELDKVPRAGVRKAG